MAQVPTNIPPGHSTGPRTAEGKARSSQNSYKHGSCSSKLLLPDEDPQELQDVMARWTDDYDTSTSSGTTLATETGTAYWLLIRQRRRYNEAEQFIADQQPDPMQWTAEQHKHLQLFLRYLNAAERTFHRNLAALEAFRSRRIRESQAMQRVAHRTAELEWKRKRHAPASAPASSISEAPATLSEHHSEGHSEHIAHRPEPATRPILYAQLK